MDEVLRVRYTIEQNQDQELDAALKECLEQHGWYWCGSGFNYRTGERDLAFDREEVAEERQDTPCGHASWIEKAILP